MSDPHRTDPDKLPALGRFFLFTESDRNRKLMIYVLAAICLALIVFDLVWERHGKFEIEHVVGAYGIAGFVSFTFIILSTKVLKRLLSRPETYYGESAVDSEPYPPLGLDVKEHGDG